MDSDFHYFGTGTAALAAGYSADDATTIANVAQYVDWFNSDYWSYWSIEGPSGQLGHYTHPQLTVQSIDWKMAFEADHDIWNAFHFPPGNLAYSVTAGSPAWGKKFASAHRTRSTRSDVCADKLCRPYSNFAVEMISDTILKYQALSDPNADPRSLIDSFVAPRRRVPVSSPRRLALFVLGIRMHVLADTWAHQDFTGEANYKINSVGLLNTVRTFGLDGSPHTPQWRGTALWTADDTDCSAAPTTTLDTTSIGHGQLGHYPDYSWLNFSYHPEWAPDGQALLRVNPNEYLQAWTSLRDVMSMLQGNPQNVVDPPADIMHAIITPRDLNCHGLTAVFESEKTWAGTDLGKRLVPPPGYLGRRNERDLRGQYYWNPERRRALGVVDGLPTTRFGTVNVQQDSILHYMETAAAIHYGFCVDWCRRNPAYSWRPKTPD